MKLEYIGCTTQKVKQFNNRNIYSVEDLVKTLPRKYLDYRNPKMIKDLKAGEEVSVILKVLDIRTGMGGTPYVNFFCKDANGDNMNIIYFNMLFMAQQIDCGREYIFCGKVSESSYNGKTSYSIMNPTRYSADIEQHKRIIPVYSKIAKMSEAYYDEKIQKAVMNINKEDYLEPVLKDKYQLVSEYESIIKIHMPDTLEDIDIAQKRIMFDDIFYYNYIMMKQAAKLENKSNYRFAHYGATRKFLSNLPYSLTDGQKETLEKIAETTRRGERVNAVVMGDVGCGKTLVAELAMLMAYDEGYQSVLLAPTVVLATQHYEDIKEKMEPLGVKVAIITSQTKAKEKREILKGIKDGSIHMMVGTHSLLNPEIEYHSLALTVIDEEHKFGVKQRDNFKLKAAEGVHNISMSATPIPRTLAISIYGEDTQIYTIKTLPKGRKPIKTVYKTGHKTAFADIETQLGKGRQAYIVCPLIESSDNGKVANLKSSNDMYAMATEHFAKKGYKVGHINAKMKQDDITKVIEDFANKKYDILVSTTIIEVGVNIPNATVIYIANAERFGLAQLHQLRGRVGRGSDQGYCLLESSLPTPQAKEKIRTMCETNDGFEIAKKDLEMRGCGDFIGTVQSGENKYVSLLLVNEDLNHQIREDINDIMKDERRISWYDEKLIEQYKKEYSEEI